MSGLSSLAIVVTIGLGIPVLGIIGWEIARRVRAAVRMNRFLRTTDAHMRESARRAQRWDSGRDRD